MYVLLLSLLSSCNINTPSSNEVSLPSEDEFGLYFIEVDNEYDESNKLKKTAMLETSILNDAKIFPISTSNKIVLTKVVKSDLCPIIIDGKNYYKYKNFAILDHSIDNNYQNEIIKECYTNNNSFKSYYDK